MTTSRKKNNDMIEVANAIFHNTSAGRAVVSKKFNFIYDNETGAAVTYGETAGDTPAYDPIGPQEYVIETDDFELEKFKSMFNMFAVVKEVKEDGTLTNYTESSNKDKLISMSTISNVIFKITDSNLLTDKKFKEFLDYVQLFKLQPVLMIDIKLLHEQSAFIIKELSKSISVIIVLTEFDEKQVEDVTKSFNFLSLFYTIKILVNNDNKELVKNFLTNFKNDVSVVLSFVDPYVNRAEYRDIQQICLDNGLTNVAVSSCHISQFNKRKNNTLILCQKCFAGTYSAYVKNGKISPCEFFTTNFVDLSECKTIHDFWYHKFFTSARKSVIKNKTCKL